MHLQQNVPPQQTLNAKENEYQMLESKLNSKPYLGKETFRELKMQPKTERSANSKTFEITFDPLP